MDAYLSGSIISDFAVAHYSVFGTGEDKNTNGVTADFLQEAEKRGAGEISNIYYHYFFGGDEQNMTTYQIYGVDKTTLSYFSDADYEKLRSGNYAIASKFMVTYGGAPAVIPEIGDSLTFTNDNWNGVSRDFEVIDLADEYPRQISTREYYGNALTVILAEEVFLDFFGAVSPMQTNINVNAEDISEFESWLEHYTSNQNPALDYISRNTLKAEFDGLRTTYLALGGAMSFILALIGVLNFINAIVASIIARRRELAMLQSVGMTGKQLRRTLCCEGVFYTALTAFFTLTAGVGIGWTIVHVIAGQAWFFKRSFTVIPSLYCAMPLLLICLIVPLVCYTQLRRVSLVERLREVE
jgi:putative ABC transport system permease protein